VIDHYGVGRIVSGGEGKEKMHERRGTVQYIGPAFNLRNCEARESCRRAALSKILNRQKGRETQNEKPRGFHRQLPENKSAKGRKT